MNQPTFHLSKFQIPCTKKIRAQSKWQQLNFQVEKHRYNLLSNNYDLLYPRGMNAKKMPGTKSRTYRC